MTLRLKLIFVGLTAVTLMAATEFAIQRAVISPLFTELERDEAIKDITRCREAIDREIHHLEVLCLDWSNWTDTYEYVQGIGTEAYDEANLMQVGWYQATNVGLMYIARRDGTLAHTYLAGDAADEDDNLLPPVPADDDALPRDRLDPDHALLALTDHEDSLVSGLMMTPRGPLLVASRPILTSESEGPRTGAMIIGRFLDADQISRLNEQTKVQFTAGQTSEDTPPRSNIEPTIETIDQDTLHVLAAMPQLNGAPGLTLKAQVDREITGRGRQALGYARAAQAVAAAGVLLLLAFALQRVVVGPLSRLTRHADRVAENEDLTVRMDLDRRDEIGTLARGFDHMLDQLEHSRARLADHARHTGRAEAASGVLHNVGNVLTSVTALTSSLRDHTNNSRTERLAQSAELLQQHDHDLPAFLTSDPRGQRLPSYLQKLCHQMASDEKDLHNRIETLGGCINHLQELVASQADLAGPATVDEPISVARMLDQVAANTRPAFEAAGITLGLHCETMPTLVLDRRKLSQVLVNVLTNAHDAVNQQGSSQEARQVDLTATHEGDHLVFTVRDNGIGIAPELIERIFSDGFTTKPATNDRGRGMGLHYCAISAIEMGGRLSATSEGPGQGACFRLEIPWHEHAGRTDTNPAGEPA